MNSSSRDEADRDHAERDGADGALLTRMARGARLEEVLARFAQGLGVSLRIEDAAGHSLAAAGGAHGHGVSVESRVALRIAGQPVGSMIATAHEHEPGIVGGAGAAAELVAELVGEWLAQETELRGLTAELLSRYEEVNLLYDLSGALAAVFDVPTLCEIALGRARRAVDATRAVVVAVNPATDGLDVVAAHGCDRSPHGCILVDPVSAHVVTSGQEVLLHPGEAWPGDDERRGDAESVLSVPLIRFSDGPPGGGPRALGALTLTGKGAGRRFSAGDARVATTIATELAMAIQNSRLVDAHRQAERDRREVEIAAGIQRSLLPATPPTVPGAAVAGICVPATSVGGDYFDMLLADSGRLTMVIADVAGHSIGSALMMAMARIILRREAAQGQGPAAVLRATNDALLEDLVRAGLFITAFCAEFDPPSGRLRYANAGHNLPLVCRASHEVLALDADGMPVGILDGVDYEEGEMALAGGDVLLLYTDGVVEARRPDGEQFGDRRLRHALVTGAGGTPSRLADDILAAVRQHLDGGVQQDDITVLAFKVAASEVTASGVTASDVTASEVTASEVAAP